MQTQPVIDTSLLPADVRKAGRDEQARYVAAMQFEQMLVQRMMSQMLDSNGGETDEASSADGEDGGSGATSAVTDQYRQMLPELLAKSVTQAGGIGLAQQLYEAIKEQR